MRSGTGSSPGPDIMDNRASDTSRLSWDDGSKGFAIMKDEMLLSGAWRKVGQDN